MKIFLNGEWQMCKLLLDSVCMCDWLFVKGKACFQSVVFGLPDRLHKLKEAQPTSCVENQLTEMLIVLQGCKSLYFVPPFYFTVLYGKY